MVKSSKKKKLKILFTHQNRHFSKPPCAVIFYWRSAIFGPTVNPSNSIASHELVIFDNFLLLSYYCNRLVLWGPLVSSIAPKTKKIKRSYYFT